MSGETLVSLAVRTVMCDICDCSDDVVEYLTSPSFFDSEEYNVAQNTKTGVVRIYRLCRKCLTTGIAVLNDSK